MTNYSLEIVYTDGRIMNMKCVEPGGGVTFVTSTHEVSFGRTVPELQAHRGIS